MQTNFSMLWRSSLPVRGISGCGIEALSNLVPHLEQLHMLALWGRLWSSLGFRFWNGFRLAIPWDETVINNIFGEVKLALKDMAKAPNPMACCTSAFYTICTSSSSSDFPIVVNVVRHATIRGTRSGNISHGHQPLGCSCKWNVCMSRRNYQRHDPTPLSLYNRSTTPSSDALTESFSLIQCHTVCAVKGWGPCSRVLFLGECLPGARLFY